MNPATPGRTYYPALDNLRGLAILLVLLHHYFSSFQIGWVGVDLFFVLSGFLITDILLKQTFSKAHVIRFYLSRALRIFPIYYMFLALFFVLSPLLFSDHSSGSVYHYYTENKIWFWSFLQNWAFIKQGPAPVPYLSPLWSLAVEWQFYLLWPFVLHLAKKFGVLKQVIVILIGIALCARGYLYLQNPEASENYYYNSICRMDSLLIGGLLAVLLAEGKTLQQWLVWLFASLGAGLVFICGFIFYNLDKNNILIGTVGYTVFALFFMTLLHSFLTNRFLMRLSVQPLKFLGRISYGVYIYHLPIYLAVAAVMPSLAQRFSIKSIPPYVVVSVSFVLTIAISVASYQLFEKPMLRLKTVDWRTRYPAIKWRPNLLTRL